MYTCVQIQALSVSPNTHTLRKRFHKWSNPVLLLPKVVLHRGFSSLIQPQLNEAKGTILIWMNSRSYFILWWCCHKKRFASAQKQVMCLFHLRWEQISRTLMNLLLRDILKEIVYFNLIDWSVILKYVRWQVGKICTVFYCLVWNCCIVEI